jgi:hypothetical protein
VVQLRIMLQLIESKRLVRVKIRVRVGVRFKVKIRVSWTKEVDQSSGRVTHDDVANREQEGILYSIIIMIIIIVVIIIPMRR